VVSKLGGSFKDALLGRSGKIAQVLAEMAAARAQKDAADAEAAAKANVEAAAKAAAKTAKAAKAAAKAADGARARAFEVHSAECKLCDSKCAATDKGDGFITCTTGGCPMKGVLCKLVAPPKAGEPAEGKRKRAPSEKKAAQAPVCQHAPCGQVLAVTTVDGGVLYSCKAPKCPMSKFGPLGEAAMALCASGLTGPPRGGKKGAPAAKRPRVAVVGRGSGAADSSGSEVDDSDSSSGSDDDDHVLLDGSSSDEAPARTGESSTGGGTSGTGRAGAAARSKDLSTAALALLDKYKDSSSKVVTALAKLASDAMGPDGALASARVSPTWSPALELTGASALPSQFVAALGAAAASSQALDMGALASPRSGLGLPALAPFDALAVGTPLVRLAVSQVGQCPSLKRLLHRRVTEPDSAQCVVAGLQSSPLTAAILASPDTGIARTTSSTLVDLGARMGTMGPAALRGFISDLIVDAACKECAAITKVGLQETPPADTVMMAISGRDHDTGQIPLADQIVDLAGVIARSTSGVALGRVAQLVLAATVSGGQLAFLPRAAAGQRTAVFQALLRAFGDAAASTAARTDCVLGAPPGVSVAEVRQAIAASKGATGAGRRPSIGFAPAPAPAAASSASVQQSPARPARQPTPAPSPASRIRKAGDDVARRLQTEAAAIFGNLRDAGDHMAKLREAPPLGRGRNVDSGEGRPRGGGDGGSRGGIGGSGRARDDICNYFQSGNCRRGDSCRFRHIKRERG
jgi:hypothetical protein